MVFLIAILGGQGACLILITLLQSIMTSMSVLCVHFVSSLMVSYFFGALVYFEVLSNALLGSWGLWFIIIFGAVMYLAASMYLPNSDGESEGGLLAGAANLTKGVINKRLSGAHLIIQLILSIKVVIIYAKDWEHNTPVSLVVSGFWLLNLAVPLILLAVLDEDSIKDMAGSPSEDEQYLMMNKGKDGEQGTSDFWMFCLIVAFSVGQAFTTCDMAGPLTLRNSTETYDMI
eukprot:CAMPEP_0176355944 /NCGR_PEP_ID=MMETSP0126-20121128/13658_1 /TAXON_ID=141414 ORGANISM="Strombidinopsis acuminatum, Strain SPMC142" /NCGR_SAMPLE_ID=MMETSP0126 /ASSEMBLY_ACC=CAM_ASM_000229 /LENGTH=230 /DNA_ID=CAMNT_0017708815 /DNA_START=340 /DNA_END=1032 /DNA_ORIENTATION=-